MASAEYQGFSRVMAPSLMPVGSDDWLRFDTCSMSVVVVSLSLSTVLELPVVDLVVKRGSDKGTVLCEWERSVTVHTVVTP